MRGPYFKGYAAEVDPATLHFTAIEGATCEGCLFYHQRSSVCHKAERAAALVDLPGCEQGFIYILDKSDARQMRIKSESPTGEAVGLSEINIQEGI